MEQDQHMQEQLNAIEEKLNRIEKIVVKTRKVQRNANTVRMLYWVFLILLGLGAFYFIKPFFSQLKEAYGFGPSNTDTQNVNDILDQLKSFQDN